jgi:3-oxoacyl-[acyl-carrier-protein] synthase II
MKLRRVKVTGIGFVTPAGIGKEEFRQGITSNHSFVVPVTRFPSEGGEFVAAEISDAAFEPYVARYKISKKISRHTQFALVAASLALRDAGLDPDLVKRMSPVVVTGTSLMDSDVINKTIENVLTKGPRHALTRVLFHGPVTSVASAVSEAIGGARTLTLQSACCSGSDAIGHAMGMVARGESDIAICGGTEAPIFYHPMLELKMAGLSPNTSENATRLARPFDMWRTTGVIGEGACFLVLEPEASPREGYAFISGYAFATDPRIDPGSGLLEAMRLCAANARLSRSDIEMVSAWGPGHKVIDGVESRALNEFRGGAAHNIPVVSIKGTLGNPFGAGGAIQLGCTALCMKEAFVPPTVNWSHPDPSCVLNLASHVRNISFSSALVNSHGLSGTNSCLILQK